MTRHLATPLRLVAGGFLEVEQGSDQDVQAQVRMLMRTRPGDRLANPSYGIADPTFAGWDRQAVIEAVTRWLPSVNVEQAVRAVDDARWDITVGVEAP